MHTNSIGVIETPAHKRLTASLGALVGEGEQMLKAAQRDGTEKFNAARDRFKVQIEHAKFELEELEAGAVYQARRAARHTVHALREHPYAAMGIAAGTGILLGMLLLRRLETQKA